MRLNNYYDQLHGEKYILYVPNNGHGIKDYPRLLGGLSALYQHATANGKAAKDKLPTSLGSTRPKTNRTILP